MCIAAWVVSTALILSPLGASPLEFGPGTILIYENRAGQESNQFVLRIARFHPDIVLEWESLSHQGTIHLFQAAVEGAGKLTIAGLFDPGSEMESRDQMTKWLSRKTYEALRRGGELRMALNNSPMRVSMTGEGVTELILDHETIAVSVIHLKDNRRGVWTFHASESNPVLIAYENPYYRESLKQVFTNRPDSLRWIRRVPPVR
jgi:hypothetical protein